MTDKELIQAFHECERHGVCPSCPLDGDNCPIDEFSAANLIKRMESLLYENEHLREATKMIPKWVSVDERLPEMHAEIYDDIDGPHKFWRSETALGVNRTGDVETVRYNQEEGGGTCWEDEPGNYYEITHWMPLPEPPSTEGVE